VNRLDASEHARQRVRLVLGTIAGTTSIIDAALALGVSESAFHKIREQVLQGALGAAEPKPIGRPPTAVVPSLDAAAESVAQQNRRLRIELEASRIREEIALTMPHLLTGRHKKND
jgi:hypothetical protein